MEIATPTEYPDLKVSAASNHPHGVVEKRIALGGTCRRRLPPLLLRCYCYYSSQLGHK